MMLRRSLLLASLAFATPVAAQTGPVVDAPSGSVQGTASGEIRAFRGIPYAVPPVGAMRWRPPAPMAKWKGVKTTTEFGPACIQPQAKAPTSVYSPAAPMPVSEDCLTLNIWAPKNAKHAPIFFWIHGGALVTGSSREPMYDGQKLAERGVIVVSINYRLGVLGYLAHPGLSAESPQHVSGNYGLLDQIAALQWVRYNIGAFGGDPAQVTIAGESAGALSVMYLMESPLAKGLFARAIAESGYMISMPELKKSVYGAPSGEAMGQMLGVGMQAPDIAALRGIDPQSLTDSAAKLGFGPWGTIDGLVLTQQMTEAFDKGEQAKVPMLIGFNQGEIRSLMVLAPKPPATAEDYEKTIRAQYGDLAEEYLRLYPAADYKESIIANTRDALYGWTAERMARKQSAIGQNAYLYLFDHGYPDEDAAGLHAFHASELPFVFGTTGITPPKWPKIPETAGEKALSDAMLDYWSSFAKGGMPQSSASLWPAYGKAGNYMHFADVPKAETGLFPGMYKLHETAMCRRKAAKAGWNWNTGLVSPKLAKAEGCE
jgi:para-nitrobenzyl esterase